MELILTELQIKYQVARLLVGVIQAACKELTSVCLCINDGVGPSSGCGIWMYLYTHNSIPNEHSHKYIKVLGLLVQFVEIACNYVVIL